jgi:xanthine dehydrogenase YagR molybdenum-binding subunit
LKSSTKPKTIDVAFVLEDDPYVNPLGVKGIGEIGNTGAPAAIVDAACAGAGWRFGWMG